MADIPTFGITEGRYYVDGILCENEEFSYYSQQPYLPVPDNERRLADGDYLVFLDVWERLMTSLEDASIREVALGDADTCARSQVVWQVKTLPYTPQRDEGERPVRGKKGARAKAVAPPPPGTIQDIPAALEYLRKQHSSGLMAARLSAAAPDPDPCITPPDSRYRGAENQLYRVEIHTPGTSQTATFKWSRDNGSVIFPIASYVVSSGKTVVTLDHLGRDDRSDLEVNDWVEVLDDNHVLREKPGALLRVEKVDTENYTVTLDGVGPMDNNFPGKNGLLRRWDHINRSSDLTPAPDKAFKVIESTAQNPTWLTLEDGIQIRFDSSTLEDGSARTYQTGDYWLIPARTSTGAIEWPVEVDTIDPTREIPVALPAAGIHHHYAPLASIEVVNGHVTSARESYSTVDENGNSIEVALRRGLSGAPLLPFM
jgi:hypothetical protein